MTKLNLYKLNYYNEYNETERIVYGLVQGTLQEALTELISEYTEDAIIDISLSPLEEGSFQISESLYEIFYHNDPSTKEIDN